MSYFDIKLNPFTNNPSCVTGIQTRSPLIMHHVYKFTQMIECSTCMELTYTEVRSSVCVYVTDKLLIGKERVQFC